MVTFTVHKLTIQARGTFEPNMIEERYLGHHRLTGAVLEMTPECILRLVEAQVARSERIYTEGGSRRRRKTGTGISPREACFIACAGDSGCSARNDCLDQCFCVWLHLRVSVRGRADVPQNNECRIRFRNIE